MSISCIACQKPVEAHFKACPSCGEPITDFLREYGEKPLDGKYEILARLGTGGMGEVYKVRHIHLDAIRVVKVIRPNLTEAHDAHDRFIREAKLATRIQHPNVSTLHDFSSLPDGSYYMVWEYIEGFTLGELIRSRGRLTPLAATRIAIEVLMGLDAVHRAGVIHRDISPDNIMITTDSDGEQHVKIIDLGIAKQGDSLDNQTRTGMFIGKLKYCSPEHIGFLEEGQRIDGRSDIYSFGIVMYEMLAGSPPFVATGPHQYFIQHSKETPKPLRAVNPAIDAHPQLEAMIFKALEKNRENRFATAREFARELERLIPSLAPATQAGKTAVPVIPPEPTMRTRGEEITQPNEILAATVLAAITARDKIPATGTTDRSTVVPKTDRELTDRSTVAASSAVPPITDRSTIGAPAAVHQDTTDRSTVAAASIDRSTVAAAQKGPVVRRSALVWIVLAVAVVGALIAGATLMIKREAQPRYVAAKPQTIKKTAAFPPSVIVPTPAPTLSGSPASLTTTVVAEREVEPSRELSTPLETPKKKKELVPQEIRDEGESERTTKRELRKGEEETVANEEPEEQETAKEEKPGDQSPSRISRFKAGLGRLAGGGGDAKRPEEESGFKPGVISDYSRLRGGGTLQWEYVAPGVKLSDHTISVNSFRNMSNVKSGRFLSMLHDDLQAQLDELTSEGAEKGTLTTQNLVYWAEDASNKTRGVGIEMVFRDPRGRVVAEVRHLIRENSPEDASEEMVDAIVEFVEEN